MQRIVSVLCALVITACFMVTVQSSRNVLHAHSQMPRVSVQKGQQPANDPPAKQPVKEPQKEKPVKEAAKPKLKLIATVDGYTEVTEYNPQKYPFQYTGESQLDAEQVKALAKSGKVPEEVSKAVLGCLLWPKANDELQSAVLKSDGKKLTGEVDILHKYGEQGTHLLELKLEGTVENGRLDLKVTHADVTGTWHYGKGMVLLQGSVDIKIETKK